MQIFKTDGTVLIDLPQYDTIKDAVEHCVKNEISLSGADLYCANLSHANLRGAYLRYADLRHADLRDANLSDADLRHADLYGAKGIYIFNKAWGRTCYAVEHENAIMIIAGCFFGSIDEFEIACKERYPNDPVQDYEAQIKYLREILK